MHKKISGGKRCWDFKGRCKKLLILASLLDIINILNIQGMTWATKTEFAFIKNFLAFQIITFDLVGDGEEEYKHCHILKAA